MADDPAKEAPALRAATSPAGPLAQGGRGPAVRVVRSKVHGLWHFLLSLAQRPNTSEVPRALYTASPFDTLAARDAMARFERIREMLAVGGSFKGFPKARGAGFWLEDFFTIQAALSRDLEDFSGRTLALLPPAAHNDLLAIMREFEPAYDALLWAPSSSALALFEKQVVARLESQRFREGLETIGAFYGAKWPDGQPALVSLVPLPGKGLNFAHRYSTFQEYEVRLQDVDFAGHASTITHEICHALFDSQTLDLQRRLDERFRSDPRPLASLAYRTLDEALATALGDAWMYTHLGGDLNALSNWYNERYVDGMARALLPTIVEYLKSLRTLDEPFADAAVAAFAAAFPGAHRDLRLRLRHFPTTLLTDGEIFDRRVVVAELKKRFQLGSVSSSSPIANQFNASDFARPGEATFIIVAPPSSANQLVELAGNVPEIKSQLLRLPASGNTLLVTSLSPNRVLVVVRARNLEEAKRGFEQLDSARTEWRDEDLLVSF